MEGLQLLSNFYLMNMNSLQIEALGDEVALQRIQIYVLIHVKIFDKKTEES